jgi:hypothetical protein
MIYTIKVYKRKHLNENDWSLSDTIKINGLMKAIKKMKEYCVRTELFKGTSTSVADSPIAYCNGDKIIKPINLPID